MRVFDIQVFARKGLDLGKVFFGKRFGAAGKVVQEVQNLLGRIRHFGCQRQLGVVFEAEQFGGFQRVCKRLFDVGRVVEFAFVSQFAGTGNVGAVDLFAQFAVVGVLITAR